MRPDHGSILTNMADQGNIEFASAQGRSHQVLFRIRRDRGDSFDDAFLVTLAISDDEECRWLS